MQGEVSKKERKEGFTVVHGFRNARQWSELRPEYWRERSRVTSSRTVFSVAVQIRESYRRRRKWNKWTQEILKLFREKRNLRN